MAASKLSVFSIFLALLFTSITAAPPAPEVADSSPRLQLEQLKSKVSLLESSIDEKNLELRKKDETIRQMEKIIQEKSNSIALLQNDIQSVQGRESLDATQPTDESHLQAGELEKQVKRLREDIKMQNKKKDELEARASVAEQKIRELNLKLENLRKVNGEQKIRIRKTERALQVEEEEMMKEKFGASSISKDLTEVHGGWLPSSLAVHKDYFQSYIVTYWNEHGRPTLDVAIEKALEMKAQVGGWLEYNTETIKSKWIPSLKKHSLAFIAYLEPKIQSLTAKTVDVYHSSKSSIAPLVFRAQQMADPYFQEAKKFTEPYIEQVTMVTRPHIDKAHVALKPYTKQVLHAYRKFIKSATFYHLEVQEMLKNNELTQPFATIELAWFAATALLALPAVFLFKLYSAIFRKKSKKRIRSSDTNHARRRLKRAHPEK